MALLVVHNVRRYLGIVVLLRGEILRVEGLLGQKLPEFMFERFNDNVLGAHGTQPIDSLRADAALSVVHYASEASLLHCHLFVR